MKPSARRCRRARLSMTRKKASAQSRSNRRKRSSSRRARRWRWRKRSCCGRTNFTRPARPRRRISTARARRATRIASASRSSRPISRRLGSARATIKSPPPRLRFALRKPRSRRRTGTFRKSSRARRRTGSYSTRCIAKANGWPPAGPPSCCCRRRTSRCARSCPRRRSARFIRATRCACAWMEPTRRSQER